VLIREWIIGRITELRV